MSNFALREQVRTAKAAKIGRLRAMIEIADRSGTVAAFVAAGGSVTFAPTTNRASYAGASGTCTWSKDAGLIEAWRKAALRLIEKLEAA